MNLSQASAIDYVTCCVSARSLDEKTGRRAGREIVNEPYARGNKCGVLFTPHGRVGICKRPVRDSKCLRQERLTVFAIG